MVRAAWSVVQTLLLLISLSILLAMAAVAQLLRLWRISLPLFRLALRCFPYNASAHIWLGETYARLNRWEEAGQCFATAYAIDPANEELGGKLEEVFAITGRPASALTELKALSARTSEAGAWMEDGGVRARRPSRRRGSGRLPVESAGRSGSEVKVGRPLRVEKKTLQRVRAAAPGQPLERERCGLCRKRTKRLTQTECCGRPICDDEGEYVLFSYARNSCSRNHRRLTLCGFHHMESHSGEWKNCDACRNEISELEMYVYFGTNEYNFEKLLNPPAYEPTRCRGCGRVIVLGEEGYSHGPNGYRCEDCFED